MKRYNSSGISSLVCFLILVIGFLPGCGVLWNAAENVLHEEAMELQDLKRAATKPPPENYTGLWVEHYPDGRKAAETHYQNGLKHGKRTTWYPYWGTDVWEEEEYRFGKLDGLYRRYLMCGTLREEYSYKEGKRQGRYRHWHDNGRLYQECWYDNDLRNGEFVQLTERGRKCHTRNYKNGKIIGDAIEWYPSGQIRYKIPYENGVRHGTGTQFDKKGNLIGKLYYEKGKKITTEGYRNNELSSRTWYDEDEKWSKYEQYKNGEVVKRK